MIEPGPDFLHMNSFESRRTMLIDPAITEESDQISSSEEAELFDILNDLQQQITAHDEAYDGRTNNLNNMRRLIARLMKKSSRDVNVQTDAVEFAINESAREEYTGNVTP